MSSTTSVEPQQQYQLQEQDDESSLRPKKRKLPAGDEDKERPLSITCNSCRDRKVKCTGSAPCGGCVKNGTECIFRPRLKPGLKSGTVDGAPGQLAELQARVQELEQWRNSFQAGSSFASTSAGLSRPVLSTPGITLPHSNGPVITAADLITNGTRGSNHFPSIAEYPFNGTQQDFHSAGMASIPFAGHALPHHTSPHPSNLASLMSPYGQPSPNSVSATSHAPPLPPDEIVRDLIELYFIHVAPWAPIIAPAPRTSWNAPWPIHVYAMVAVSLRFSHANEVQHHREHWHSEAKKHVILNAVESTSITSLQALSILVLDSIGSGSSPDSWGLLALLTRSAVHLGLSKDDQNVPDVGEQTRRLFVLGRPSTFVEEESWRRLFWVIFMIDRYACVATGWDFAIPDFEVKRRLPCRDDLWDAGQAVIAPVFRSTLHEIAPNEHVQQALLSPLAYLIQLLDLLGRVHVLQAQAVDVGNPRELDSFRDRTQTLSSAVRRCFASMPGSIEPSAGLIHPNDSLAVVIKATYFATLLKLNARLAYPAEPHENDKPHAESCTEAVAGMAQLTRQVRASGSISATSSPFFVWCVWVAARVSFIHSYSLREPPSDDLQAMIDCLQDCAPYWGSGKQYAHLLGKALERWRKQDPLAVDATGSAISVLLDMRKTAYSAVALDTITPAEPVSVAGMPYWATQPILGDLQMWYENPSLEMFLHGYDL